MKPDRLRSALRELDQIDVAPRLPSSVSKRARRRRIAAAVGSVLTSVAILGLIVGGASILGAHRATPDKPPAAVEPVGDGGVDGWRLTLLVEPTRIASLKVSVSDPRRATPNDSDPWVEHDIVFENQGQEPVTFDDTRTSEFLDDGGSAVLLAADEGCGYGKSSADAQVEAGACRRYLDEFTVQPGHSESRRITLFKELPGMASLQEGDYVFYKSIAFRVGEGDVREQVLRITYTLERADS